MKQTLIGILLLGIASLAEAQGFHKLDTTRLLEKLEDKYRQQQSPLFDGQPSPGVIATFSHNAAKGKVYTLTPDNMPCLVPYSTSKMPVSGQAPIDKWMNPGNLQPIIPPAETDKSKGKK